MQCFNCRYLDCKNVTVFKKTRVIRAEVREGDVETGAWIVDHDTFSTHKPMFLGYFFIANSFIRPATFVKTNTSLPDTSFRTIHSATVFWIELSGLYKQCQVFFNVLMNI